MVTKPMKVWKISNARLRQILSHITHDQITKATNEELAELLSLSARLRDKIETVREWRTHSILCRFKAKIEALETGKENRK